MREGGKGRRSYRCCLAAVEGRKKEIKKGVPNCAFSIDDERGNNKEGFFVFWVSSSLKQVFWFIGTDKGIEDLDVRSVAAA